MTNDNFDLSKPDPWNLTQLTAYSRKECLNDLRKAKDKSPLAGLTDRGIDLTKEEEADLREFAARKGVSFDDVADFVEAAYTVIGQRSNSKMHKHLVNRHVIPRNLLASTMKNLIYLRAVRRDPAMA